MKRPTIQKKIEIFPLSKQKAISILKYTVIRIRKSTNVLTRSIKGYDGTIQSFEFPGFFTDSPDA